MKDAKKDKTTVELVTEKGLTTTIDRNDLYEKFEPIIKIDENITAPVSKGEVLGKATYHIYDKDYTINLIASNDVAKKADVKLGIFKVPGKTFMIFGILATLLFAVRVWNKSKRRKKTAYNVYRYNRRFR